MHGKIEASDLLRAIQRAPGALLKEAVPAFRQTGRNLDRTMQSNRLRGRPGVKRRSGRLAGGFNHLVTGATELESLKLFYWTRVPYALQQEEGGEVRPKRGKYLTIPLKANLTPAGVMRMAARQVPGAFFAKSRRGKLIMFGRNGKKGKPVPMFVLVDRVRIPARLGLFATWDKQRPAFLKRLEAAAQRALEKEGLA